MISSKVLLCAIPQQYWETDRPFKSVSNLHKDNYEVKKSSHLHTLVKDALIIEELIDRGINPEVDRYRYHFVCSSIEQDIPLELLEKVANESEFEQVLSQNKFPFTELRSDYLEALAMIMDNHNQGGGQVNLGRVFVTPEEISAHLNVFSYLVQKVGLENITGIQRKFVFYELAKKTNCGVIEIQRSFQTVPNYPKVKEEKYVSLSKKAYVVKRDETFNQESSDIKEAFQKRVQEALALASKTDCEINISNFPHYVITEIFHDFVYRQEDKPLDLKKIHIVYSDGSEARPFPFLCRPVLSFDYQNQIKLIPPLRIGLMSMRHLQMDKDVSAFWFRNQDIQKARTFGETDQFCYELSKQQLRNIPKGKRMLFYLFHTGLPSAVVGFYRAFVEEAIERNQDRVNIAVVPYYYRQGIGYIPGKVWG